MPNLFDYLHELLEQGIHPVEREQEIHERYGRTVAVMVVDSSGFSRVTERHGILHFLSRLMEMRRIIQAVCIRCEALSFRFEADNVYAAFERPETAIEAASEIHQAIAEDELMLTDEEPYTVCIGIGYGDMLYSETMEGFFGEEMNLASKLGEDTADKGETLITQAAHRAVSDDLLEGFEARRLRVAGIEANYYRLGPARNGPGD